MRKILEEGACFLLWRDSQLHAKREVVSSGSCRFLLLGGTVRVFGRRRGKIFLRKLQERGVPFSVGRGWYHFLEWECFSGGAFPLERGAAEIFFRREGLLFGCWEKRGKERDSGGFSGEYSLSLGCYGEEFWCQRWEQIGFVGEFERKTREKLKENKGKKWASSGTFARPHFGISINVIWVAITWL